MKKLIVATVVLAARLLEDDSGIGIGKGADVLGALLVTASLMLGVYAIVESSSYGLGSTHTLAFGALSIGLLVAFVVRQAMARNPILPLRLFRSRNVTGANLIQALMVAAFFGMFFMGSLYMERVLHYGPLAIGRERDAGAGLLEPTLSVWRRLRGQRTARKLSPAKVCSWPGPPLP